MYFSVKMDPVHASFLFTLPFGYVVDKSTRLAIQGCYKNEETFEIGPSEQSKANLTVLTDVATPDTNSESILCW